MTDPKVVIIGAGAAGIGAGLECQAQGIPFVIIEAADRVGGRAFTATGGLDRAWDWGCHWMHCANENPLVAWADRLGTHYKKRGEQDADFTVWDGGAFGDATEHAEAGQALDAVFAAIEATGKAGRDIPASEVMPDFGRWAPGIRTIFQLMSGDDPEVVSAAGYADYAETDTNWPVLSGYGDLIKRMATDLPIRLGVAAAKVRQTAQGIDVQTNQGVIHAKAVIVTASTNVLASGAIRFEPGPAADLVEELGDIPCGAYEKVAFTLSDMPAEFRGRQFATIQAGSLAGAVNFQIVEDGGPMLIHHIAGTPARDAVRAGPAAMTDLAVQHLVTVFGGDVTRLITGTAATGWTNNPLILGSYSHARPGKAAKRRELIKRDTGPIGFAGEAFSLQWEATAHGAYQSGRDVAARIISTLPS
ncbi:FAD-dependent oxidoreductase [Roseovarius aestuarii]|nr:FAD-dependent oxidoreductase [Roseovarius aestuarii]